MSDNYLGAQGDSVVITVEEISLQESDLRRELLPRLVGRVFHVTSAERFQKIVASGALMPNHDGALGDTYSQSAISLARSNGYICLFDLRDKGEALVERALENLYFLAPRELGSEIVFLFLSQDYYTDLIEWKHVEHREHINAFRVPDVECWFDGPLPLSMVGYVLRVGIQRPPLDPNGLLAALMTSRTEDR